VQNEQPNPILGGLDKGRHLKIGFKEQRNHHSKWKEFQGIVD
jgi:hypothetical protein